MTTTLKSTSDYGNDHGNPIKAMSVDSGICHGLINIIYPLARRVVIPFHFGQLTVTGQENVPKTGPIILAPTHRSRWDALMVPYAVGKPVTGRDLRYMVSANEIYGLQGWLIRRLGGFPVNTGRGGISSIRHTVELLSNGEALVMFPEGNIFRNGEVNPLKPGMARIALQVESSHPGIGLNIVPISLNYSQPIPKWGCDVTVTVGSPISVADYSTQSVKKGAAQLTHDLHTAMTNLDKSYPQDCSKKKLL
ncbi:1-acyl-sn-glycerol-3-phosphate acyltransferase [Moorena sp. SIO3I8]|uniref:lysophospholipid acyltransferase family protein n=1 Tax=Moorena sp. SIO3I8 TaxID=2607833 RepID=UPI0025FCFF78|nr:1-acyl-sn-glycerol-3-phosphate acyltransferase [Moorena sp. SIO3I8]